MLILDFILVAELRILLAPAEFTGATSSFQDEPDQTIVPSSNWMCAEKAEFGPSSFEDS
jgi:hypothetical protein